MALVRVSLTSSSISMADVKSLRIFFFFVLRRRRRFFTDAIRFSHQHTIWICQNWELETYFSFKSNNYLRQLAFNIETLRACVCDPCFVTSNSIQWGKHGEEMADFGENRKSLPFDSICIWLAHLSRPGPARPGSARLGPARPGPARPGTPNPICRNWNENKLCACVCAQSGRTGNKLDEENCS